MRTASLRLAIVIAGLTTGLACSSSNGTGASSGASGHPPASSAAAGPTGTGGGASTGGSGGAATTSGAGGAATTGTGTGGHGNGGGAGFSPPPTKSACATPTVTKGDEWNAPNGDSFPVLAVSYAGGEVALLYSQAPSGMAGALASLQLQRLSSAGKRLGSPVVFQGAAKVAGLGLASDVSHHVFCWDGAGAGSDIECASLPVGGSQLTLGLSIAQAKHPSLAFGAAGFVLAYDAGATASVQPLGSNANSMASPTVARTLTMSSPALVATTTGYGLVTQDLSVIGLGPILAPLGSPVSLGTPFNGGGLFGAAACGELVGAVFATQSSVVFAMTDASGTVTGPVTVDDPTFMGTYGRVSATRGNDSFALAWSAISGDIGYRAVNGSGAPLGTGAKVIQAGWDDNPVAIIDVDDGFLVVAATGVASDTMTIVHLGCP